ncbi:MAG: efflux RND transporter permease subunit, partial [Betaproteobacteria bacterium]|nr:efflux RND transporter permease subunit [Betaproteobacteria bacterium]
MASDVSVPRLLRRKVLWLLVLGVVLVWAIDAFVHTPVEVLPSFDFPQISVTAHVPGTTATELEHLVVQPLEGQILSLPGLRSVRSVMGNGTVEIDVRFGQGSSAQADLLAVGSAIDRARARLPSQAHPVAQIMGNAINEVADYTVEIPAGIAPARVQRLVQAEIAPALRAIPGVQFVHVYGAGDEALWIQPDLGAMRRYDVGVEAIERAVKAQVLLAPAGYLSLGHNDVLIEARELPVHIRQLEQVPVTTSRGPIPLRALARVERAAMPTHNAVSLDGRPSVAVTVIKQPGASTRVVTQAVQAALEQSVHELPAGVRWVRTYDQGHLV